MKTRTTLHLPMLGLATGLLSLGLIVTWAPGRAASNGKPTPRGPMTQEHGSHSPQTALGPRGSAPTERPAPEVAVAIFAGGCFWCIESAFDDLDGVLSAVSGYTGGDEVDPSYAEVSSGQTGHVEAVRVRYDPRVISYTRLLEIFWRQIDPTDDGGQFADRGRQYRSAIFVLDEEQQRLAQRSIAALEKQADFSRGVATRVLPATAFYPAEAYHQDFYKKNPARYQAYRRGSGRQAYIDAFWKKRPPFVAAASDGNKIYRKPDAETLRHRLTPLQYEVTQKGGTERPFANAYYDNHRPGLYVDVVSGEPLFSSQDKFDSGSGWPSFTRPLAGVELVERRDQSLGMSRVEARSPVADSHLGHVFDDGPAPSRQRYCINSAALRFVPLERLEQEGYGSYRRLFDSPQTSTGPE